MASIAPVSQAMQTVLTTVADTAARTTGFVQRVSKLTGALFTQTLVLGFLSNAQATRESLAQTAATLGLTISPQGLDQRMTETGADCLLAVLDEAAATVLAADPVAIPLLTRFNGVFIQDSTLIGLPPTLARIWRGSGNQHITVDATACLKLSVRLNLTTGALDGPHPDHGLTSDQTIPLQDAPIPAGALRIADLGCFALDMLQAIGQADGFWPTRPHVTTVMADPAGQRLDLPIFLAAQATATVDVPIRLGARARLDCRLLAVRCRKRWPTNGGGGYARRPNGAGARPMPSSTPVGRHGGNLRLIHIGATGSAPPTLGPITSDTPITAPTQPNAPTQPARPTAAASAPTQPARPTAAAAPSPAIPPRLPSRPVWPPS
jgi:hypothetical protein